MAISDKEAARQIIDALPDDATLDDAVQRLVEAAHSSLATDQSDASDAAQGGTVNYHPERRGRFTVLVPDRPVAPPLTAEVFIEMIEQERLEREARFLGLLSSQD